MALCASALGILIAAIARTENQIGGMGTLVLWGMGLLGGCIAPAFLLDRYLGPLPKIVPQYWANRAFDDLLLRGLGLQDVALELAVLLGFTILFFVIGLWRFDFE
jgi:ABC-2 type transport system permease protein